MAKPGVKVIKENKHKIDFVGILKVEDEKIMMDVSKKLDGSNVVEVIDYLEDLNDQIVKISVMRKDEL